MNLAGMFAMVTRRDERGQMTVMIVGFAAILLMAVALVVDASAAYLQRQGLATLADGAALAGANGGAMGREVYGPGLRGERADLVAAAARTAVRDYFSASGATERFPGAGYTVTVGVNSVVVRVHAPLDLPLAIPGSPDRPRIAASGSAIIGLDR
ncbi:MAG: pilus assembly protein TadG-related protein [Nocardioides sp.]